ncbi:Probable galactinol--sucrose galactosyltransferase 4 [Chondrus crispus]|uniref:galactinol--sucrose galactosyltransferase n=1 Tax=Chondrus crispus TaxID=2769 RepID=R7QES9_CHOCR|nr:Probable galactinol--sucrose galactosyltransferase 4 [Chondrus crispus]CDF35930.1 Probable galactinol--sucrose galactosyltransferase 4 [Chondrus crispus]|eukprot:XP_005715749.1 Probable galactinol--sucrose galactosyltransferase 4 [Chondrus crispus]
MVDLEVDWIDVESGGSAETSVGVVRYRSITNVANTSTSVYKEHRLVESFCLTEAYVVVSYDAIPLTSASITVSVLTQQRSSKYQLTKPKRVHYGVSTSEPKQWVGTPQDSYFRTTSDSEVTFQASFDMHMCETDVLGLSFVLQLEDETWVKNRFGEDFYVGGGKRKIPCAIEIPFTAPSNIKHVKGQMLTLHRTNPFWLQPSFAENALHHCEQETQFVLLPSSKLSRRKHWHETGSDYLVLLPLVDNVNGIRASLFGISRSNYSGIRLETGRCTPLELADIAGIKVCVAVSSGSPYHAVRYAVKFSAGILPSFSSRLDKVASHKWDHFINSPKKGVLTSLGYCTWDGYSHMVCEAGIMTALQWLAEEGISPGYTIVDDGWQAGGGAGPNFEYSPESGVNTGRPTLSSFHANDKFANSLRSISSKSSAEILAWVAIIGYWGGTSGFHCDVKTQYVAGALASGLHLNNVEDSAFWEKSYEIVHPGMEFVARYFEKYFVQSLAESQGVSGVKIDAQSILEILCNPIPHSKENKTTRISVTASYRAALTKAVERAFPSSVVLNSMACGPETVYCSGKELSECNICWRTSNDHAFPGVEESAESVSWHILCNAMTSVFLGEIFPVVDWDMFRVSDRFARLHAVARISSGGPLYFSDAIPFQTDFARMAKALLKSLTTHEGHLLRCQDPGRPTLDCLFVDPRSSPTRLFKVFNRNSVLGLICVFNLNPSEGSPDVLGSFQPSDLPDFTALTTSCRYLSLIEGSSAALFLHENVRHGCELRLPAMCGALVHICPVFEVSSSVEFACLGQPHLLNAGAALQSISISKLITDYKPKQAGTNLQDCENIVVELSFYDYGTTYVWLGEQSHRFLLSVASLSGKEAHWETIYIGEVKLLAVQVPPLAPWGICMRFENEDG